MSSRLGYAISVEELLNILTEMAGPEVTWTVRHETILITTIQKAAGELVIHNHDISDIIFGLTDFLGPRIGQLRLLDEIEDDDGGGLFGGLGEKPTLNEPDDLETLIRDNVSVGTWDEDGISITIEAEGYAPSEPMGVVLPPYAGAPPLEIVLRRWASLAGRVVSPGGEPIAGAEVVLGKLQGAGFDMILGEGQLPETAKADGRGEFVFTRVTPGSTAVQASMPEEAREWISSESLELDVRPGQDTTDLGARRLGLVRDDGDLVAEDPVEQGRLPGVRPPDQGDEPRSVLIRHGRRPRDRAGSAG